MNLRLSMVKGSGGKGFEGLDKILGGTTKLVRLSHFEEAFCIL